MRQNRPMASDRAKPRMAYENSCCFREGFLREGRLTIGQSYQKHQFNSLTTNLGCCGFSECSNDSNLAYPMMREPKTEPIPAPEPATPTVAAPAPMNLAAESMSDLGAEVDSSWQAWMRELVATS